MGVQDLLEDFLFLLTWENAFPRFGVVPEENKTIKRPSINEITPEIQERLIELNWLDLALVAYARDQFLTYKNKILGLILDTGYVSKKMMYP